DLWGQLRWPPRLLGWEFTGCHDPPPCEPALVAEPQSEIHEEHCQNIRRQRDPGRRVAECSKRRFVGQQSSVKSSASDLLLRCDGLDLTRGRLLLGLHKPD